MKEFYDYPTQVKFFISNDDGYGYGIAYGYVCIDALNGSTFDIAEYFKDCAAKGIPEQIVWKELDWASLEDAILFGAYKV